MGLLDDIKAYKPARPVCTISILLAGLPDDDRADLEAALATPGILGSAIVAALKRRGHPVSLHTMNRHMRQACSCE